DVLILGGGISGLAAALTLARQQHTAVVLDSEVYRNAPSPHMHNVLTWDRVDPKEFRAAARKNILDYYTTIDFEKADIVKIEENKGAAQQQFTATDNSGAVWNGRKVILAVGVRDIYPEIEGYTECWAKAIYHCFFCKGYEARGVDTAGILAIPDLSAAPAALHAARTASRFTKFITIYTHGSGELDRAIRKEQGDKQVFKVDDRRIARFEKGPGFADLIIHFENGETVTEGFLGHKPPTQPKGDFHKQLGLEMTPIGDPVSKPMFCETTRKGVFVSGDGASPIKIVPQALFSGSAAAAAACAQLQAE
ncbi:putative pyridine nucleotide-disulfide oxidoreductase, partial [Melanomma pulvis-pyrius CBS 109.77]